MLIVDTGPILAAADRKDPDHQACLALLATHPGPLVTTPMVVAEAAYMICRELGAASELAMYDAINSGGLLVESLGRSDWERITDLVKT